MREEGVRHCGVGQLWPAKVTALRPAQSSDGVVVAFAAAARQRHDAKRCVRIGASGLGPELAPRGDELNHLAAVASLGGGIARLIHAIILSCAKLPL